jgi:DNA-binding NarL/FixJ family response regulator
MLSFFVPSSEEESVMVAPAIGNDWGQDEDRGQDKEQELVNELVRRLIALVAVDDRSEVHSHPDSEQIILDLNVDGVRYLLVRTAPLSSPRDTLTSREREIAGMVAKGYHNKTIAAALKISSWTVCTHLRRIFAKLGVTSRAAMVARLLDEHKV